MGMHADCGHGMIMATNMAHLHMQLMTSVMTLQWGRQSTSMCAVLPRALVMSSLDTLQRVGVLQHICADSASGHSLNVDGEVAHFLFGDSACGTQMYLST